MITDLTNKYFLKNTENGEFQDVTTLFDGVRILKVDGMLAKGEPINIYNEQWINSQSEDFLVTTIDEQTGNNVVIRKNVDIEVTFIVRQKYATTTIDVMDVHDNFVSYLTDTDIWLKSAFTNNKVAHCICLAEYKPTICKLQRGEDSWMMGTITLHTLDAIS